MPRAEGSVSSQGNGLGTGKRSINATTPVIHAEVSLASGAGMWRSGSSLVHKNKAASGRTRANAGKHGTAVRHMDVEQASCNPAPLEVVRLH